MVKFFLSFAQWIRRFCWWLVRPSTRGVRAIIINQDEHILLVKHIYTKGWFLPGGRVRKCEDDEGALRRELREEVGVEIITFRKLGEYTNTREYKEDVIVVFVVTEFTQKKVRHFEIKGSEFFQQNVLPEKVSPGTRRRIEEFSGRHIISGHW